MNIRYEAIPSDLFVQNRKNLYARLEPNALVILNSNDVMPTNADGTMAFRQNNDLFYLSGVDQEESVLLLYPNAHDPANREVLFLRETNEHIAIWEGARLTKEQAQKVSGIKNIQWLSSLHQVIQTLMADCEYVYLNTNEHTRAVVEVPTRDSRFVKWCMETYPLHQYRRLAPHLRHLRAVKSQFEVDLIAQACKITEKGFRRILGMVKPGVMEYEVEAELAHEFLRNRSRGFAYTPIIASGGDSCVLHYISNNKECKEGDLLLIDAGAEYANYASDLTRTIPVSGKFTPRQKDVYNAVLRVMRKAIQMLVPGNTIDKYHREVGAVMEKELIGLGLLNEEEVKNQDPSKPLYKRYFMHGTSHGLGLDVHDVWDRHRPIEAGMVFTCEPGIYIREENIGIRLENDILVTNSGPVDLMKDIPLEAEEIEQLMQKVKDGVHLV